MRVRTSIEEIELEGDEEDRYGDPVIIESVRVTCNRCQHSAEAFGTSHKSVLRCAAALREECPRNERNFYLVEELVH